MIFSSLTSKTDVASLLAYEIIHVKFLIDISRQNPGWSQLWWRKNFELSTNFLHSTREKLWKEVILKTALFTIVDRKHFHKYLGRVNHSKILPCSNTVMVRRRDHSVIVFQVNCNDWNLICNCAFDYGHRKVKFVSKNCCETTNTTTSRATVRIYEMNMKKGTWKVTIMYDILRVSDTR